MRLHFAWVVLVGLILSFHAFQPMQAQDAMPCAPDDSLHRVSLNTAKSAPDGSSSYPSISANGRYVAFASDATDLVVDDTNGVSDVFVFDRQTCETTRVSVSSKGQQSDGASGSPDISDDGRWVVFDSAATNLVMNDHNGFRDVFVRDQTTGETKLVSITADGVQGEGDSAAAQISADGQRVAFGTSSNNLVPTDHDACALIYVEDTMRPAHGPTPTPRPTSVPCPDVLVADLQTDELIHVSLSQTGIDDGESGTLAWQISLSSDGRYVAFGTYDALITADTNYNQDIYVYDIDTGTLRYIAIEDEFHSAFNPVISGDGHTLVFVFWGGTPEEPTTNGEILAYDLRTGQFSVVMPHSLHGGSSTIYGLSVSADGRFVGYVATEYCCSVSTIIYDRQQAITNDLGRHYFNESNHLNAGGGMALSADGRLVALNTYVSGTDLYTIEVLPARLPPLVLTFVNENNELIAVRLEDGGPVQDTPIQLAPPGQHHQWVLGDWDGDGVETPGAYADDGVFYWVNTLDGMDNPANWSSLWIGLLNRPPLAGRFEGNHPNDCIGVMDWMEVPAVGKSFTFYFTCDLTQSGVAPELNYQWYNLILPDAAGYSGSYQFTAGDWNGDTGDSIVCRRGSTIVFTNDLPYEVRIAHLVAGFQFAQAFGAPDSHDEGRLVVGDWNRDDIPSFGLYYQNGMLYTRDDLDWDGQYKSLDLHLDSGLLPVNG